MFMQSAVERRLITVAIHTYEKAVALKALLESEGVETILQNVNLEHPVVSAGMRVRIHEDDLPLALRIIENREIFLTTGEGGETPAKGLTVLVPVDFSSHSEHAVDVAFRIAQLHGAEVVVLHSYVAPSAAASLPLSSSLTFDDGNMALESESAAVVESEAKAMMETLRKRLRENIKSGQLPGVKFTTRVVEGVPEASIERAVKELRPWLLVMGTRPASQKKNELVVGSVSAEVLDTCRIPALTVPENGHFDSMDALRHIVLLSSLAQEDFLALDALHRLLPFGHKASMTVVCVPSGKYTQASASAAQLALMDYCHTHYPQFDVTLRTPDRNYFLEEYKHIDQVSHIDLMVVPNRKKNVFARLFNPGIAHRVLFHFDIPMMVVPV